MQMSTVDVPASAGEALGMLAAALKMQQAALGVPGRYGCGEHTRPAAG